MSTTASSTTDAPAAAGPDPAGPDPGPSQARSWSIVGLLTRLHFYAGVLVAPFLVVAAVTGLGFVFTPQLDGLVYDRELRVAEVGPGLPHPVSEQIAAARAAHPDGTLAAVIPAADRDATTRVVFSLPELGEKQHTVYVDPYRNEVRGQLTTWYGETPLMTWFDDLHRNLHLGALGRVYSEVAASWLWVLVAGGLVLWCNRQWRTRRRVRATLLPDLAAGKGVRRTRGWHAATGVWLAIGLLFLSATGLTWSRWAGANFSLALDGMQAHSPELDTAAPGSPAGGHHGESGGGTAGDPAAIDDVLRHARTAGITGPIEVAPPAEAGTAWAVTQTDNVWPVHLDRIAVDPATGTVTARSDFADWPLLAQLSKLGIQAHMGYLFGWLNQVLLTALALGLLCVMFWGYRMWWQRRPTRAGRRAPVGTPPARGAWRRLRVPLLVAGVIVTAAVGWALPAFGVTLLAFLVVDIAVGVARHLRAPAGNSRA